MRQMASGALALIGGFVREFAAIVLSLVTLEAILLFTEAGAALDLSLRAGMILQCDETERCD